MEKIRLQKYMAMCGVASRRKSEEFITKGYVTVNGVVVKELGFKVDMTLDKVTYKNKIIKLEENKVYIIINKPKGYVTSLNDQFNRPIVTDLLKNKISERIYPIGRLDYHTTGLLILTNDGELTNKITHPKNHVTKTYEVLVRGKISKFELNNLRTGVNIGGYVTKPAVIEITNTTAKTTTIKITISEGKNRQVRKMIESVGHSVIELNRASIGEMKIGQLKIGEFRYLTKQEVKYLKSL
ncbi:pseudouridine synthase [Helicovermis profundi]|uniref:Pseudouridine synthase n=1 Tax=Helicovermis profundi TaxID=3065157 RepID=A0AAU9E6M7_9FIRM|nr:pseudouridine synthase [Clostridia bacterium S502]